MPECQCHKVHYEVMTFIYPRRFLLASYHHLLLLPFLPRRPMSISDTVSSRTSRASRKEKRSLEVQASQASRAIDALIEVSARRVPSRRELLSRAPSTSPSVASARDTLSATSQVRR